MVVETYLRRDYPPNVEDRLDRLLLRKAREVSISASSFG
jgi:hypothetical protein